VQINPNIEAYAATHGNRKGGYDINSQSPNGTREARYNFIKAIIRPSIFRRSASSSVSPTPSFFESKKIFERVKNDFPFAATLLTISTIWGGKDLPHMMYARAAVPRKV